MSLRHLLVVVALMPGVANAQEKTKTPVPFNPANKIAPAPGAAVAKPMKPDWCAKAPKLIDSDEWNEALYHDYQAIIIKHMEEGIKSISGPYDEISSYAMAGVRKGIARAACAKPDDPNRQAWVANWRQAVLNKLPITDEEDRAMLAILVARGSGRAEQDAQSERCEKAKKGFLSSDRDPEFDRIWSTLSHAYDIAFECWQPDGSGLHSLMWLVDRRAVPDSELARVAFVLHCMGKDKWMDGLVEYKMGEWVSCGQDALNLDRARLEEELKKLNADPESATLARNTFAHAQAIGRAYQERFKKMAEKKPAFKTILFDAPAAAHTEWNKIYQDNKEIFEGVYAVEDTWAEKGTKSLKGTAGPKLRGLLNGYVTKHLKGVKTHEAAQEVIAGPVGYSALKMLLALDYLDQNAGPATYFDSQLSFRPPYRGPRAYAAHKAMAAFNKAKADDERFKLEAIRVVLPESPLEPRGEDKQTLQSMSIQEGIVKSVSPAGKDYVKVAFKTESFMAPDIRCHETNRISHINRDGRFVYKQECEKVGTMRVVSTPATVRMLKSLTGGLKPGVMMRMHVGSFGSPAYGTEVLDAQPIDAYANPKGTSLVSYWGFAL